MSLETSYCRIKTKMILTLRKTVILKRMTINSGNVWTISPKKRMSTTRNAWTTSPKKRMLTTKAMTRTLSLSDRSISEKWRLREPLTIKETILIITNQTLTLRSWSLGRNGVEPHMITRSPTKTLYHLRYLKWRMHRPHRRPLIINRTGLAAFLTTQDAMHVSGIKEFAIERR